MSTIISTVEAPARRSIEQTCDELAALLLAVISVISLLTFRDYGLGWDDYTHAEYADLLLQLYRSGFHEMCIRDSAAEAIEKIFGKST